jgi:transposase
MNASPDPSSSRGRARVKGPQRSQVEWRPLALDELLADDHRARIVWQYVQTLDLSSLYADIRAVEGEPGRDAVDPRLLLALWLLATIEGVGSARQLDRLCERDLAYLWMCGGVTVNYHLLADFRTMYAAFLDDLLTRSVAALMHQGLVTLERVAQDGMKVRASAGSSSFRGRATLEKCQAEAEAHLANLRAQQDEDAGASERRRAAARLRAAEERQARIERALEELADLEQRPRKKDQSAPRSSTTDPEARRMKMADGGFRPAYNVQFCTDGVNRFIVEVDATNQGSDWGRMAPLHEQLQKRYGRTPRDYLVDCGFPSQADIEVLEERGTTVYAPVHGEAAMRKRGVDPFSRRKGDNGAMVRFRTRMATDEAKQIYKQRSSIAEYPNAECRNRGFTQLRVRGAAQAKAIALWHALAFNLMRMISLGCVPGASPP